MTTPTDNPVHNRPVDASAVTVTDLVTLNYPNAEYDYRTLIRSYDENGVLQTEHVLQTRRKPEWIVSLRQPGRDSIRFVLQYRPQNTHQWHDAGTALLHPQNHLNGHRTAVADLPMVGWREAPHLRVQIRLSAVQATQPTAPTCPFSGTKLPVGSSAPAPVIGHQIGRAHV